MCVNISQASSSQVIVQGSDESTFQVNLAK